MLDLHTIHIPSEEHQFHRLYQLLTDEEKQRSNRFSSSKLAKNYIIVRGILKILLGEQLSISPDKVALGYSTYGKPFIENSSSRIHFNVSHSGEYAAFIFSKISEVGIDIEKMNPEVIKDKVETIAFSERELEWYSQLAPPDKIAAFYLAWTQKESVLKAEGKGLSGDLTKIESSNHLGNRKFQLETRIDYQENVYQVSSLIYANEYMLSIAHLKS